MSDDLQPAPDLNTAGQDQKTDSDVNSDDVVVTNTDAPTYLAPANSGFVESRKQEEDERNESVNGEPHEVEVDFTYVTHLDPARQRDPNGVYLDDVMRAQAEIVRARQEGREPDLENPGPTASDVVVRTSVAKQLVDGTAEVPVAFTSTVVEGVRRDEDAQDSEQQTDESVYEDETV
jgi:hypothetical protein